MIIVDNALKAREAEGPAAFELPLLVPASWARDSPNQIMNSVPGMRMVAGFNRRGQRAIDMFAYAGRTDAVASWRPRKTSWKTPFA